MRALLCLSLLALLVGCATTSSGGPLFRLRPKGDTVTGEPATGWSGNFDILAAMAESAEVGAVEFDSNDSLGFRISARPASWYIAPEVGLLYTEESNDNVDLEAAEVFGGARIGARFEELPVEIYGNGGFSYLDSSIGDIDDETNGFYVGGGICLYLGSDEGFTVGAGYRLVDQDWDLEEYGEFVLHAGWAW